MALRILSFVLGVTLVYFGGRELRSSWRKYRKEKHLRGAKLFVDSLALLAEMFFHSGSHVAEFWGVLAVVLCGIFLACYGILGLALI